MWLVCLLANQHATFTWKDTISLFLVSQGSAEALIRWGGKIYHLSIACFLSNIFAKFYKNPTMLSRVIAENNGVVYYLRHSVSSIIIGIPCSTLGYTYHTGLHWHKTLHVVVNEEHVTILPLTLWFLDDIFNAKVVAYTQVMHSGCVKLRRHILFIRIFSQ